nr:flagellar hook-length control protein FliK [Rubellimicrobium arenae]
MEAEQGRIDQVAWPTGRSPQSQSTRPAADPASTSASARTGHPEAARSTADPLEKVNQAQAPAWVQGPSAQAARPTPPVVATAAAAGRPEGASPVPRGASTATQPVASGATGYAGAAASRAGVVAAPVRAGAAPDAGTSRSGLRPGREEAIAPRGVELKGRKLSAIEGGDGGSLATQAPSAPLASHPLNSSGPSGGPAVARHIARQVAEHPAMQAGGTAEMTLAPKELGHLRLSVEVTEAGLRVVIEAARPDTADLMRRHVETLRQELQQEGLGSVSVSIGGGGERNEGTPSGQGRGAEQGSYSALPSTPGAGPASSAAATTSRSRPSAGHLDLRF